MLMEEGRSKSIRMIPLKTSHCAECQSDTEEADGTLSPPEQDDLVCRLKAKPTTRPASEIRRPFAALSSRFWPTLRNCSHPRWERASAFMAPTGRESSRL